MSDVDDAIERAEGITDDALMCFAQWCRSNDWRLVLDPVILRRVFTAYSGLSDGPVTTREVSHE